MEVMKDLIYEDELVNDFEFSQRLYETGLSQNMVDFYEEKNLIWADMY